MMSVVWYSVVLAFLCQAEYITASTRWPEGSYGLLKPKTGCPKEWKDKHWEENGWIDQGTEQHKFNQKSKDLHIDGNVLHTKVKRYFCIRNTSSRTNPTLKWPKGQYCIYSKYPPGMMRWGSIGMNEYRKWLPTSASISCETHIVEIHNSRMHIHFACQTSGNKKIPISLPITKPFYLLPYKSPDCQQVQWMVATSEWITYETYYYHSWNPGGMAFPHYELGTSSYGSGVKMYYCYYKSCNYTLDNTSGVFKSPGFPHQYPDGQLCRWKIMVPDNLTLVVNFTKFSLYEYDKDCLQLYENNSGVFEPKQAFFGHQRPFIITATSDLMFVFRSDEENNSSGFRAEYTVFETSVRTTTAAPTSPATTTPPSTTAHPTTNLITTKLPTTKQPTTKLPTSKHPIITELETIFSPSTANDNSTTNETCQCNSTSKNKSYNKQTTHLVKKTFCEETWKTVVMVIPLVVLILIALVIIEIICRWRSKKALKSEAKGSGDDDGMIVNPTYGRGSIVLNQPSGTVTDTSVLNIDQSQSRDDLDDYEDVDYTQLNEIPPPRRSSKRQECHALEPIDADTSAVFYHVLEPGPPQSRVAKPVGNGGPDVIYHTLEPPTVSTGPAYQNPSDGNLYTLNPLYEAAENSAPFVEANKLLYDSYM